MANKTNVVITIENGAVNISVRRNEASGPCMSEAVSPLGNDRTYESAFYEEETSARFIEEAFGVEERLFDCLKGVVLEELLADLFGDELEVEAGSCPSCDFVGSALRPISPSHSRASVSPRFYHDPVSRRFGMPIAF